MSNWLALSLTLLLLADADVPRINSLRPSAKPAPSFPSDEEIPLFPSAGPSSDDEQSQGESTSKTPPPAKNTTLQETSKLTLIRFVSGEFAKAVKPVPAGKEGFHVTVGKPLQTETLDRAVATHGPAINSGDSVQITKLEFRDRQIVVDVNGGGRGRKHWRDHIQIGFGGAIPTTRTTQTNPGQQKGPPGQQPGVGSTIFLEFTQTVPALTPQELNHILSPLFYFPIQR